MKQFFSYILLLQGFQLFGQPDTLLQKKVKQSVYLEEIEITAPKDNLFGISRLHNIEGTTIYAGKKTEAIYLQDLNANLATNNSRQIFAKVAGINIFENDGSGSQIGIGGRGLNPNRISNFNTRQNGYDISADALGYPESYYTPPTEAIERIEVLRGAASLQFGTQFGGMINYKFAEAPRNKKILGNFRQTGASFGFINSFNQIGGTVNKISYNVFYQYKQNQGWRPNSSLNYHNAFGSIKYQVNEKLELKAEVTYLHYISQQPGGLTDAQFNQLPKQSNRTRNWFKVDWNLFSFSANYKLNESTQISLVTFGLHAGRDALGFLGRPDRNDDTTKNRNLLTDLYNNVGAEIKLLKRYSFLDHQSHFLIGTRLYKGNSLRKQGDADKTSSAHFSFLHPHDPENSAYLFPSENVALFGENIFQLTKKWSITPGIRLENIKTNAKGYYRLINRDLAGNILLDTRIQENLQNERHFLIAGIGTQYMLRPAIEFYCNFSQNYRSINFNDMRVNNPSYQVDPNLKDEKGYTADAGLRGAIKDFIYYDLSFFLLKYNQRIGTILTTDSITYNIIRLRTNVSDSRNAGIESFVEIDWMKFYNKNAKHQLSTFVNIALLDAIYTGSSQNAFQGKKVEYAPELIFRTGLTYAHKGFSTTLQYAYTSMQYSDATNAVFSPAAIYGIIPSYQILDFSVGYRYKRFGFYTGINNLGNSMYFTRRTEGYPGPGILPADPINGYFTIQYKF